MENDFEPAHLCHMFLPVLGGSFTCTAEINKLALKWDNASAALFYNQTVKRQQLYLAAKGDWHGRAAVFLCFCWPPETRKVDPAQSKSSHTLLEPLTVSTAQPSLDQSGSVALTQPMVPLTFQCDFEIWFY